MRKTFLALAALATMSLVATSSADIAAAPVTVTGTYLVGSPGAYFVADACTTSTDGIDSSCEDVPAGVAGRPYSVSANAALDAPGEISVCFYSGSGFIRCDASVVPEGAKRFSVTSNGGVKIDWAVTFS